MAIINSMIFARIIFVVLFLIVIPVGLILLQIFLSKKENKWLGLILPITSFAFSLFIVLGMVVFMTVGSESTVLVTQLENGEVVRIIDSEGVERNREMISGALGGVFFTFLLLNIPTAVFLIIYKVSRSNLNRRREIEKMSVQDL